MKVHIVVSGSREGIHVACIMFSSASCGEWYTYREIDGDGFES